jgi:acyl dehydratase
MAAAPSLRPLVFAAFGACGLVFADWTAGMGRLYGAGANTGGANMKLLGHGFYWQDFTVGDAYETYGRTIAAHDITAFCNLAGIVEPLFTDAEYRQRHSAIAGFAAPGALVMAVAEGLVLAGTGHGTGLAFLHADVDVKAPVIAGDTVRVRLVVTEVRAASKATSKAASVTGRGLVRTRNEVINQHGAVVLVYTPLRLMAGQPEGEAPR